MPEGGTITLRTRLLTDAQQVHVEVGDTGVGMDEDTRRPLLRAVLLPPRVSAAPASASPWCTASRGATTPRSRVDSAPGQGTTIRLVFPLATAVAGPVSSAVRPPIVRRLRILLIDDDPLLIKSLRDVLEIDGHVVVQRQRPGAKAWDLFAKSAATAEAFARRHHRPGHAAHEWSAGRPRDQEDRLRRADHPAQRLGPAAAGRRRNPHIFRVLSKPPKLRKSARPLAEAVQSAAT